MIVYPDGTVNSNIRMGYNGPYLNPDGSVKFIFSMGKNRADVMHNLDLLKQEIQTIGTCHPWQTRKFVLPDLLPLNPQGPVFLHHYQKQIAGSLVEIGQICRSFGIRCSTSPINLENNLEEILIKINHFAFVGSALGFRGHASNNWHDMSDDFFIPIRLNSDEKLMAIWPLLSYEARNFVAIMYIGDKGVTQTLNLASKYGIRPLIDLYQIWQQTGHWLLPDEEIQNLSLRRCLFEAWGIPRPTVWLACPAAAYYSAKDQPPVEMTSFLPKLLPEINKISEHVWHAGLVTYIYRWLWLDFDIILESSLTNLCVAETMQNVIALSAAILKSKRNKNERIKFRK